MSVKSTRRMGQVSRGWYSRTALLLSSVLGCGNDLPAVENVGLTRIVEAEHWDTLFVAGDGPEGLLAGPHRISLIGDQVLIADGMVDRLVALDRRSGRVNWISGKQGGGPAEFRGIADIKASPTGSIWIMDYGNGRIAEWSHEGHLLGSTTLQHTSSIPSAIVVLDDRVIAMSPGGGDAPFVDLTLDSLRVRNRFALAWPDSVPAMANVEVVLAEGEGFLWVSAFAMGPGFTVWTGNSPKSYRFIDEVPFALKVGRAVREAGADSARFGAVSMTVVGNEIYMLFGGRPIRSAHAGEPTIWVDVYSLNGKYSRSYKLPIDSKAMATDGETFYLVSSEGVPRVVAIRPRSAQAVQEGAF